MTITRRNVLLGATAAAALAPIATRAQTYEVVIGVIYQLPGASAQIGVDAQKAFETAADIIRRAMVRMDAALAKNKLNAQMLLQVHDELVFEVPDDEAKYSGRFLIRVPASLHADLARSAGREGVSLNSFVPGALAGAVGWRKDRPSRGSKTGRRPARRRAASQ
ncbi:toxin-antitoxin system HicB family antitoxin [Lacticaseibacillus rhamnosus]